MSVPYETAAYEPSESAESPQEHLARLLTRALNSFDLPEETTARLEQALVHDVSLHSAHHSSAGPRRETYRHTWLLDDGSPLTLWELVHNTGPDATVEHEIYAHEDELATATARLPLPPDTPDFELPVTVQLPPVPEPGPVYAADDSADHARRLLRRAENTDHRPGPETAAQLRAAFAHQITQAFGAPCRVGQGRSFVLYEHAFLLIDGREISLWEVEHTATPDGRHMCEVYPTEETARWAMERRATRPGR